MRLAATFPTRVRPLSRPACLPASVSVALILAALRASIVVISLNMRMSGHLSDGQGYSLGPTLLAKLGDWTALFPGRLQERPCLLDPLDPGSLSGHSNLPRGKLYISSQG